MTAKRKPNYQNTIMYFINVDGEKYYGHTVNKTARKAVHKYDYKRHPDYPLYKRMREIGYDIDNIDLVFVENYPCATLQEAKRRERWWIENHGSKILHKTTPSRSQQEIEKAYAPIKNARNAAKRRTDEGKQKAKEHYQTHKEQESARHKEYYAKNKDKFLNKYHENKDEINAKRRARYALKKQVEEV